MKLVLAIGKRLNKDSDVFLLPTLIASYQKFSENNIKCFGIRLTWIYYTIGICVFNKRVFGSFFGFVKVE